MKEENVKRIALIGGAILPKMVQSNCFKDYKIVDKVVSLNPVSLYTKSNMIVTNETITDRELDLSKAFNSYLNGLKADYIVINLEYIKKSFYYCDNNYYTETSIENSNINLNDYKKIEPTKIGYQIRNFPDEMNIILSGVRRFAKELLQVFPNKRIILLSCLHPAYFIVANNLNPNSWYIKYNDFLREVEKAFKDITQCIVCNFPSNCCPLIKKPGIPLASSDYYSPFFQELTRMIGDIINNNIENTNVPSLEFFVNLYKIFENDIINRKNYRNLISSMNSNLLDFMLNTSANTIETNYKVFEKYFLLNLSFNEMVKDSIKNNYEDINALLNCYEAILKHDYCRKNTKYHLMFKYKFSSLDIVVKDVQLFVKKINQDIQVTKNNLAFYFAYMQLHYQIENGSLKPNMIGQLNNMVLFSNNKLINVFPTKIDIWGSCISRFMFNANERDFKVNRYLYHVDPLAIMSNINLNTQIPQGVTWEQSRLWYQLNGLDNFYKLFDSKSEWLVIDNFSLTAPNHFITPYGIVQAADVNYATNYFKWPQKHLAYLDQDDDLIIQKLEKFVQFVKEKYNDKIIFVKIHYHNFYIESSGKIQDFSFRKKVWGTTENDLEILERLNQLSDKTADYIIKRLGCYVIDLAKFFFPDERSYSELHHLHLERTYFNEAASIVKMIVQNSPSKRIYDDYSANAKLDRFISLRRQNNDITMWEDIICNNWLDKIIIKIPQNDLIRSRKNIISLYNKEYKDFDDCYNNEINYNRELLSLLKEHK